MIGFVKFLEIRKREGAVSQPSIGLTSSFNLICAFEVPSSLTISSKVTRGGVLSIAISGIRIFFSLIKP